MLEEMEDTPLLENIQLHIMDETNTLQIVLLGKTGSGKSSLANTICGGLAGFNVSHSARSETKVSQSKTVTVNGRQLRLIDTPGLFDTEKDNTELSLEDVRFLVECAPGVHAFVILLKVERFTKQEREVTKSIFKQLTKEALKYTTVVFTHGDQLPDEITIESWVEDDDKVKALVQKCGGRCHVFDNKYWNNSEHEYRNNKVQVENLLQTIEETVKKYGGKCYTNENLQRIEEEIKKAQEKDPNISRDKAKEKLVNAIWPKIKDAVIGSAVGILVGAVMIPVGIFCIPLEIAAVVGVGVAVASGAIGGIVGNVSRKKKEKKF